MGWILGEKFNTVYPHKGSIKVLWESRWKFAVCGSFQSSYFEHVLTMAVREIHLPLPRWRY